MGTIQFTNAGIRLIRDALMAGTNPQISYIAIGTGTGPLSPDSGQLSNEVYRKEITDAMNGPGYAEGYIDSYIGPTEAAPTAITEAAWFGGDSASATLGTGIMIARGLYAYNHGGSDSIQFILDFLISN